MRVLRCQLCFVRHQPSGIGTVRWIWRDDSGKSYEYLVEDALFSPQSPINILSVTCFARQLNDLTGTGIDTIQLKILFILGLKQIFTYDTSSTFQSPIDFYK